MLEYRHAHQGRGSGRDHQVVKSYAANINLSEPVAFYFNMLRYPFVSAQGARAPLLMLLLVVTQVVNAVGFLWESTKGTEA